MTVNLSMYKLSLRRWATCALALALFAMLGAPATFAQNGGGQKQQLEELKTAYAQGIQAAKQNNPSVAYQQLERAQKLAQETDQSGAAQKISQYLSQLPKQWGNKALKNESYEEALRHFNKGIEHSPNQAYLYYGKGLALINLDRQDEAMESLTQAISKGEETGDMRSANLATTRIQDHFVAQASEVLNTQNPSRQQANQAISHLDEMENYVDSNAKAHFYRATALFHLGQLEQAISTAEQGLGMHEGSRSSAAKYHFVIGEAQMQLGNTSAACSQFNQANYGDYSARAEHYLENECGNS